MVYISPSITCENNKSNIHYKTNLHMLLFSFLCLVQSKADTASLNTSCFAPKWKCFIFLETSKKATTFHLSLSTHVLLSAYELSLSTAIGLSIRWRFIRWRLYPLMLSSWSFIRWSTHPLMDVIRWSLFFIRWCLQFIS